VAYIKFSAMCLRTFLSEAIWRCHLNEIDWNCRRGNDLTSDCLLVLVCHYDDRISSFHRVCKMALRSSV
jgi:hypothetical protein